MRKILILLILLAPAALLAQTDTLSITLENVKYPHPVKFINLTAEGQDIRMAYMDIKPASTNGKTIMLFHGKNFAGYYWKDVIKSLTNKGYRVIVPDQIGFGKSSKPFIHYSFHLLAKFSKQLLDTLGIAKTAVLGHSMGGMLATRFALQYPETTTKLLLENPIGFEDYRTFVPYITTEEQYKNELKTSAESVKRYYQSSYFPEWRPEYDYLVKIAAGVVNSVDFPRYAKVSAMTFTMIYEQPVVYEYLNLKVPTVLFIGIEDKTIVGKGLLSKEEQAKHGQYKVLGKQIAAKIPGAKLVEFEGVGHIPHVQIPSKFNSALIVNL
ncbi:pimeloyl-ACP methyl ester carboxylesterase [Arcticibacter tournemirensis]|uniref:Alpha/beta hydrolase n=1 Tax=Arcticibacter tournemirensis TaxID=699437 RepID=A0A4Q0MEQ6_9SPHI|nr:alpha/beta hydrolase [Arcticibacter tournemirensis]KAA8485491.1 alpha/beta hydrolase [Arcticibacter tournemirensis]RXF71765.1 alpha/beta hydrolase [Arcticibacter tournemirensis]TQM48803.1 pimeloyl-ACP methyl ester carboxylesterase [Arcticibacter tournemirensis]